MRWIYVLYILAAGAIAEDSFERVRRAPGKRCPRIQNFPGKVKYKRRGTRAQFRCYKNFSRYGPRFVSCRADNTWSGEPPLCIKAGCVPIDIQHLIKLDMTESYSGALLSFKCEDNYQLIGPTEISCDSKVWSATPPVCKAPIQLKECDFEFDLCGWTQDDSDELDWERTQGQTSTGGTGPKTDHTFQDLSGHYMFVESSNPARNGDQARLLSPVYPADMGDMCFEFWYHILGPDDPGHVGTLEVYVRGDSEFIDDLQPLFMKSGNQGDVWKRDDIYIDKRDEPFQIVIVTTRKLSYISDIAIDDVRLYNCSGKTTSTTTTSTTKSSTLPSYTSASTISSTVPSATLSTSLPTGLPRSAITSTFANGSSSTGSSSTGTTSLFTPTPSKSSSQEITTVPVSSDSGNVTPAVTTTTTSKYLSNGTLPISTSTSLLAKSSTVAASSITTTAGLSSKRSKSSVAISTSLGSASVTTKSSAVATSSIATTTGMSSTRSKSSIPISTSLGSTSVTTSPTLKDKITTSMSVTMETKTVSKLSPITTTQLPVTSSTAAISTSTTAPTQSTSTPKLRTSPTLTTSTVKTVKPTTFSVPSSTTSTEKLTSTSTMKTSSSSTRVQTETSSTTSKPTSTTVLQVSTTAASTTPTSTKISTKETTSQPTTSTASKPTTVSQSTFTKLGTTSATTAKSSSTKPTTRITRRTVITQKQTTIGALLNKTVSKTSTPPVKVNKTVSTESKVTTVGSNDTEPIVVAQPRSQHPVDDTLRPLMIGLGVGIVAGLIIIGVVAWVCVRRRKFYTSRYEDELKPITKSSSNDNFNNIQYEYHDDEEYQ